MTATASAAGLLFGDVAVGTELPAMSVDVTATLVVAGAVASRDFQPVHHDGTAARAGGARDVFLNILTTNGLVCRFVTDWAGPDALLLGTSIRLGAPCCAGDRLTLHGSVVDVFPATGGGGVVEVSVVGRTGQAEHVTGVVRLDLPGGRR